VNIDKYMKKAYGFFAKTPKEQKVKIEKLEKILAKLTLASNKLSKDISKAHNKEKREKKRQELEVVKSLKKKATKRMKKLTKGAV